MSARYRLGKRIGGGGMAEVFEATLLGAEGFEKPVVIKRMLPALSSDQEFAEMFKNEARLASTLHHPNIAAVYDFDRDDEDRLFLVMEPVRGLDLRQLTAKEPLALGVAAFVIAELLRGLSYAHELTHDGKPLGLVHRDVTPHNVVVSIDGAVKLIDFGIAKVFSQSVVSGLGTIKGKLAYMSPEQAAGQAIDHRSDLFSVGVMAYELLTQGRLFSGGQEVEVWAKVMGQRIAPPHTKNPQISPGLSGLVCDLLERDVKLRVESAKAALDRILTLPEFSPAAYSDLAKAVRKCIAKSDKRATLTAITASESTAKTWFFEQSGPLEGEHEPPVSGTISYPRAVPVVAEITPPAVSVKMILIVAAPLLAAVVALWVWSGSRDREPAKAVAPLAKISLSDANAAGLAQTAAPAASKLAGDAGSAPVAALVPAAGVSPTTGAPDAPSGGSIISANGPTMPATGPAMPAPSPSGSSQAAPSTSPTVPAPSPADAETAALDEKNDSDSRSSRGRSEKQGILKVAAPPWGEVWNGSKRLGETPLEVPLKPGKYRITFKNSEVRIKKSVTIRSGQTKLVELN